MTHDVDEALLLADRILVLDNGHIVSDTALDLARPRRLSDPAVVLHKADLLGLLGVEVNA